ncbi:hypothetical protein M0805_007382 [Coniferiporia weirii]|nr:hypothetical protein M0805_007382 [Coniferiporia weirii]
MLGLFALGILALVPGSAFAASANFSPPASYTSNNLVHSNFFGISIELSIINTLIGENTSSIPDQIKNYLSNIQTRAKNPVRVRVGGNSMDDSTFNSSQSQMIVFPSAAQNINDQPVTYGPVLYDVLAELAKGASGLQYLIGLSLALSDKNDEALVVSTAEQKLGSYLDGFLLGNEPDLYGPHGSRPSNYSQADYFSEFAAVSRLLNNSATYGNLIPTPMLGGPAICCNWDLGNLLEQGYLQDFQSELKYLDLQHYPQNNCGGTHTLPIDYYLRHYEVISLATWQAKGVEDAHAANIPILMSEFNTASCGGVPGISDTFGATMWALDYVLQLASVGFEGAYIHTREQGISYNIFDPPATNASSSNWTTLPTYYSLLPAAEVLSNQNGSFVTDLNLNNNSESSVVAGYGVYDGKTGLPDAYVLFNYADSGIDAATFPMPSEVANRTMLVRTLTAANLIEKYNISWGGKTFEGVGDGIMIDSGYAADQQISCDPGCDIQVPSPGVAVVWLGSASSAQGTSTGSSPVPSSDKASSNAALSHVPLNSLRVALVTVLIISAVLYL